MRFSLSFPALLQLVASTAVFILAASSAKSWAISPGSWKLLLTLALYTLGNLIIMRLIRCVGLGVALSLSAVIQLVAVNLVAFLYFGEKVNAIQGAGIVCAVIAVMLVTLGPYLAQGR